MPAMESVENPKWRTVNSDWLWEQLRATEETQVIVLDCRSAKQFGDCHIRQAVHLSLPSIMLRRIAAGKVTISSVLKCSEARQRIAEAYDKHTFVLCGEMMASADRHPHEIMAVLYKTLMQDGCRVVCLEGGVQDFSSKYPEWCVSCENSSGSASLSNLRLLSSSSDLGTRPSSRPINRSASYAGRPGSLGSRSASESEEERPDSSLEVAENRAGEEETDLGLGISVGLRLGLDEQQPLGLDDPDPELEAEIDPGFPVEILPHLFLGNAQNSNDCESLSKHHIRYVVNVTPNLPNVFEDTGLIQYLQIPITDHWSENLANFFPSAISFIDAARDREEGVLVHCLAGISRSVTITVAYLMFKMSMSLNDAYDFVRRRKSNISPNFNFMGQLLDFERQLNPPSPKRCTCNRSVNSAADPLDAHHKLDVDSVELPLTLLSMDEKVDSPTDSGLPSSVSLSPCSTDSSSSSPALINTKRASRNFVCRCQASLSQCHFTSPTKL